VVVTWENTNSYFLTSWKDACILMKSGARGPTLIISSQTGLPCRHFRVFIWNKREKCKVRRKISSTV
jgi:hypothetical protein